MFLRLQMGQIGAAGNEESKWSSYITKQGLNFNLLDIAREITEQNHKLIMIPIMALIVMAFL